MRSDDTHLLGNLFQAACFAVFWGFVVCVVILLTGVPEDAAREIRAWLNSIG
jgi:hypothetical protein